jgi:MRG-binding protein
MIALSEHLRNHGYDPRVEKHTSIPGIWAKLRTLYDLDIIDERENSFEYEEPKNKYVEFQLPLDPDFQARSLAKVGRSPSEPPSSPGELQFGDSPEAEIPPKKRKRAETTFKQRASTVEDTDATSTPAQSPPKSTKGGRGANKAVGRMKAESRSRQESKDTTGEEDEGDEDAEETEEVGEDEEQEAEEDEEDAPSPKAPNKAGPKAKASAATTRKSKRKR